MNTTAKCAGSVNTAAERQSPRFSMRWSESTHAILQAEAGGTGLAIKPRA